MTPSWIYDLIFYQIFPDRFYNGDRSNDPANVQPWGSEPTLWEFQGGDLAGIVQKLDYLQSLGVNALYLNPIFQASSVHRYNTFDYYKIDPKLGTMDDFQRLLTEAHARGMRVFLDGVFNHCGRGFFAFQDVLENQAHSEYVDWFHIKSFPLDACGEGQAKNYEAWWAFKSLPKFNTDNPDVRKYMMGVARYWIEQGADGWRLDVPNEIDDDDFWAEFRETVRSVNPEAFLIGEIWTADPRWVSPGHFDSLMHYPFRSQLLDYLALGKITASEFLANIDALYRLYSHEQAIAQFLLLGSHDTKRIRTICKDHIDLVQLAYLALFSYPGIPSIYYGDEIGMRGGKDPACRGAFPWNEDVWEPSLWQNLHSLIQLRIELPALRYGTFKPIAADDEGKTTAFARTHAGRSTLTALNPSANRQHVVIPMDHVGWESKTTLARFPADGEIVVSDGHILMDLEARTGVLLYEP